MSANAITALALTATSLVPLLRVRLPAVGRVVIVIDCRLLPVSTSLKAKSVAVKT